MRRMGSPARHHATRARRVLNWAVAAGLASLPLLASAGPANAQVDFFLKRAGPLLFLSDAAPSALAPTSVASGAVSAAKGNPWRQIGTWSSPFEFESLFAIAVGDLQIWLGLKNSDDIGTPFDLRAEVWVTDAVSKEPVQVGQGVSHCIAGLGSNPRKLRQGTVTFLSTPTAFDNGTETLYLRLLTRIGTPLDGQTCSGPGMNHKSAAGLRLYFDGIEQPSGFSLVFAIEGP